jgi:hypothetical protein
MHVGLHNEASARSDKSAAETVGGALWSGRDAAYRDDVRRGMVVAGR